MPSASSSASNSFIFIDLPPRLSAHACWYTVAGMPILVESWAPFTVIDLHWTGRPLSVASLLIESAGHRALVDPGPGSTLETLRSSLAQRGLTFQSLDSILLTHIHLDHAGATGAIVRENPALKVYVHDFGAPHMVDPSRLLASAGRLYGELLQTLYGDCEPVPDENLLPLEGGEKIKIGSVELDVFYTPGHASHHVTYWHPASRTALVGDTAGIRVQGYSFLLPATPPPDIDLELWSQSLDTIASWNPERLFLTHFGYIENPAEHIELYRGRLCDWAALTQKLLNSFQDQDAAEHQFIAEIVEEIRGQLPSDAAEHYIFNGGLGLSWRGLARYFRKKVKPA